MRRIKMSKFKNGLSMDELSELFYSEWEANRFQTEAINAGLISFIPIEINKVREKYVQKYGKLYKTELSAKIVIIDEKTGSIIEIK